MYYSFLCKAGDFVDMYAPFSILEDIFTSAHQLNQETSIIEPNTEIIRELYKI